MDVYDAIMRERLAAVMGCTPDEVVDRYRVATLDELAKWTAVLRGVGMEKAA